MILTKFLDVNNIKWFPINVEMKDGNKTPSYPKQFDAICDQNDFKAITKIH